MIVARGMGRPGGLLTTFGLGTRLQSQTFKRWQARLMSIIHPQVDLQSRLF